jgi:hypothetical protein
VKEFASFGELAEFLRSRSGAATAEVHKGVRQAGEVIWMEARREIGTYQSSSGPFPAWPDLAETTLNGFTDEHGHHHPGKIELGYAPPDNPLLRTGELRDAIELATDFNGAVIGVPDREVGAGTPEDPLRNIGDVAVDQEFGTRKMPARSFLGRAAHKKAKEAVHIIAKALVRGLSGEVAVASIPPTAVHDDDPPF